MGVGSRRSLPLPPTPTTAQTGSPTGRRVGLRRRRCGAARITERVVVVGDVHRLAPPRRLMIATQASPIGSLAGAPQRSSGAVRTRERAAQHRMEAVLEAPHR